MLLSGANLLGFKSQLCRFLAVHLVIVFNLCLRVLIGKGEIITVPASQSCET